MRPGRGARLTRIAVVARGAGRRVVRRAGRNPAALRAPRVRYAPAPRRGETTPVRARPRPVLIVGSHVRAPSGTDTGSCVRARPAQFAHFRLAPDGRSAA